MAKPQHRTPEHRAERKRIDEAQARGEWLTCVEPVCVMPTRDIAPTDRADVCHDPSGTVVTGPGHSRCNRREGAARGNKLRGSDGKTAAWVLRAKRVTKVCPVCMGEYLAWSPDQKTCSRKCRSRQAAERRPRRWAQPAPLPIVIPTSRKSIGSMKSKACVECHLPFSFTVQNGGQPSLCASCKEVLAVARRRSERRAAKERARSNPEAWARRQAKRREQKQRARERQRAYPPGTPLDAGLA